MSRGDRRRNERLERLRVIVARDRAIVAIDLADEKQAIVVCDHDSRVLARRRVRARAWELGAALEWGYQQALAAGFAGAVVGCEPTGHRWRVVEQLAAERGMPMVCVQPLLVGRARESEDFTRDKTDDKDAVPSPGSWLSCAAMCPSRVMRPGLGYVTSALAVLG